ncbi:hypothetical protein CH380_12165 [Leptospira adleri]|uniref:Uncharacterized protein n=1 Tax=Leptospira adleri TaxID=2023186 RepID=A0A2M9YNQ0_9LEPT|nr:hypothetical protein CH380_12165 [Leptospira adleri]PJZ59602.1 hypothetical protein CH376_22855 [Leptospira adleri]
MSAGDLEEEFKAANGSAVPTLKNPCTVLQSFAFREHSLLRILFRFLFYFNFILTLFFLASSLIISLVSDQSNRFFKKPKASSLIRSLE